MVVLGRHCFVFDVIKGKTYEVEPFDPSIGTATSVPVVDAALAYDCPFTSKTHILVVRNALYIPTMETNLIPPFILREAGLICNDTAKIHLEDPGSADHSIIFPEIDFSIPLQLWGVFSYFHTRAPTQLEITECDDVIMLTPDSTNWNPYSDHFASNEESMLDWEGNMIEQRYRKKHIIDMPSISVAMARWDEAVDTAIASSVSINHALRDTTLTHDSIAMKESMDFAQRFNNRAEESKFAMSIGSTTVIESGSSDLFENDLPTYGHVDDFKAEINAALATGSNSVSADFLSKIWNIKNDEAVKALDQNTQLYRQGADNDLSRRFSTNDRMLRYKWINSQFFTDTFFVTKKGKSSRGNSCAQIFVSDKGFVAIYPMQSKSEFVDALQMFCKEVGVPHDLILDPSGEQGSNAVKKFCHQVGTTLRFLEEATQWANRAELYIGLFKESIRKDLRSTNCPMVFWDYCAERRAKIHNVTPRDLFQLNGNHPTAATYGIQGDISNLCQFGWYDWCYFREERSIQFPLQKVQLGRVLGPAKNEGNEMAQHVVNDKGNVVPRRTLRPLTISELNSVSEIEKRKQFDDTIKARFGDSMSIPSKPPPEEFDETDFIVEDDEQLPLHLQEEDPVDATGQAVLERPFHDMLIHAEVLLPQGDNMTSAKVISRAYDTDGLGIGSYDDNPLLNSIVYDVEFPDGMVKQYAANTIAENMYAQVDSEGYQYHLLDGILDHSTDGHAVEKSDMYVYTRTGQKRLRQTTAGWKLLVRWKDGTEQWIPLKLLKESNPIEVAEYAKSRNIDDEAAFIWWVPYTLRKRDRIIASINSRVRKTTHKYGIEVPTSQAEAYRIDRENGNTFWTDAIRKEMANVAVAFEILDPNKPIPIGWEKSSGHLVFDLKMDFTRKARWVKDGHRTPEPDQSTFAGVVSRESVRIALIYVALNNIDVKAADIKNAYLQAPSSEKHYIICGPEFGLEHVGKVALIRRALYGGKSSGADFWKHLRNLMEHLGFNSCKADPDIWMRPAQKDDGTEYYEYVLLYVDDALCISERAEHILKNEIGKYFYIKEGSVGPPDIYLGNKVSKVTLENGVDAWSFSSSQYVQSAVTNVENYLKSQNKSLPSKCKSPFSREYRPEIDVTPELNPQEASYYQSLIGILRWIVELGRVDITVEVSMMASCMAMPRRGHLEQLYHMFSYLRGKHNTSEMVFDPSEPEIDSSSFETQDWTNTVYGNCKEELPGNAPTPRGFGFKMRAFVDADHAGDSVTRRSRTGFIVFLNSAPIYWTSKKQTSIETSSFGSEFIAMKSCCEYIRGLRYKLRMMGIPCDFPAYVYGDNQSVLANSTKPFSVLKKKSCSIAYHYVREGVAKNEWMTTYISTHLNIADLLTKSLANGEKRTRFVSMILHHIT